MAPHTPPPSQTTRRGFIKAAYLTDEQIDQILESIADGIPIDMACHEVGTSGVQFKHRYNSNPELKARFEEARGDQKTSEQEMLRNEWWHQIFVLKNWKALQAAIITKLPEGASMRTSRLEVGNVPGQKLLVEHQAVFAEAFADMTTEELQNRVKVLEASDQHPVLELNPGNSAAA